MGISRVQARARTVQAQARTAADVHGRAGNGVARHGTATAGAAADRGGGLVGLDLNLDLDLEKRALNASAG